MSGGRAILSVTFKSSPGNIRKVETLASLHTVPPIPVPAAAPAPREIASHVHHNKARSMPCGSVFVVLVSLCRRRCVFHSRNVEQSLV